MPTNWCWIFNLASLFMENWGHFVRKVQWYNKCETMLHLPYKGTQYSFPLSFPHLQEQQALNVDSHWLRGECWVSCIRFEHPCCHEPDLRSKLSLRQTKKQAVIEGLSHRSRTFLAISQIEQLLLLSSWYSLSSKRIYGNFGKELSRRRKCDVVKFLLLFF